ncbi:MFS transporter [Alicyclobacillus sp. ALC3]|uniref:MFS transporter n=1 Tax=Alicyclobacillus sp. ALC3 TaxID=2796143 RepID=UPI002379D0DC|nr:MFS transporter [Alicyclobacillus sp. ALC3]WDL98581.1 MFS transporter [Alicyclobacillus sp. ALC3]
MAERSSRFRTTIWTTVFVSGVGISAIGDFIYLVAINVFVLNQTHSASAVAGLWVVSRIAALLVGPWAGSIADRFSRRNQLIGIEIARAVLVGLLPLLHHLLDIYIDVFLLGIGSTFFGSLFLPYQTLLIPEPSRKRINSIVSMLTYSALLTGPAIAGALLLAGHAAIPLWLDAISFLISSMSFFLLPDLGLPQESAGRSHPWRTVFTDWRTAFQFLAENRLFTVLLSLTALMGIFALTADAQEVVFAQQALHLGKFGYGMMVTSAGVGYVSGALLLSVVANRVDSVWLLGVGTLFSAFGYLFYSLAHSFWSAVIGLIILGLFGSSANVGFTTYTQKVMPVSHMGRINSVIGPPRQLLNILFILLGGFVATKFGVRDLMVGMTILMCVATLFITLLVISPSNRKQISNSVSDSAS